MRDVATFPQELEKSDNSTVKAASRIGQKILLKNARKHMKKIERERFEKDPSYTYGELDEKLQSIHDGNSPWTSRRISDYSIDRTRELLLDESEREGEPPVAVMGNKEVLVDDEGSVKVDLPKLYEKWLGKWPFEKKDPGSIPKKLRYKFDADARLGFDSRYIVDKYRAELGLSRYNQITRKREWRLSLEGQYRSDRGDWTAYFQWEIPW